MKIKKRTYNTRRILLKLSYSIREVADLFDLHKNSVLNWIKDGLPIIDKHKPYLIQGSELADYLNKKQTQRKHQCNTDEFFCFKCRLPRKAHENKVGIEIKSQNRLMINGLCANCNGPIHRAGAVRKLTEYQKNFLVCTIQERHIPERAGPIVNSDIKRNDKYE